MLARDRAEIARDDFGPRDDFSEPHGGGLRLPRANGGGDARGSTGDGGMGTSEVSSAGLGQDGQAWGEPETNHERLQQQIMPMRQQGQQQRQQQYQQSHLARQFEQRERKKKSQRQKQRKRLQNDGSSALSASGKYDEYFQKVILDLAKGEDWVTDALRTVARDKKFSSKGT